MTGVKEIKVIPITHQPNDLSIPLNELRKYLYEVDEETRIVDAFHTFAELMAKEHGLDHVVDQIKKWQSWNIGQPVTKRAVLDLLYIVMRIGDLS